MILSRKKNIHYQGNSQAPNKIVWNYIISIDTPSSSPLLFTPLLSFMLQSMPEIFQEENMSFNLFRTKFYLFIFGNSPPKATKTLVSKVTESNNCNVHDNHFTKWDYKRKQRNFLLQSYKLMLNSYHLQTIMWFLGYLEWNNISLRLDISICRIYFIISINRTLF